MSPEAIRQGAVADGLVALPRTGNASRTLDPRVEARVESRSASSVRAGFQPRLFVPPWYVPIYHVGYSARQRARLVTRALRDPEWRAAVEAAYTLCPPHGAWELLNRATLEKLPRKRKPGE